MGMKQLRFNKTKGKYFCLSGENQQKGKMMFRISMTTLVLIVMFSFIFTETSMADNEVVKIGVLAKRGSEICMEKWLPTGEYLRRKIPGKKFEILSLEFDQIFTTVEKGEVDFILANPSIYVELENRFKATRISTLKNIVNEETATQNGGVIFYKKHNKDIHKLTDLKNKSVITVSEKAFAAFIVIWRELKEAGINPFKDFASLAFAGTHDAVVYGVRDGKADVGMVRTDILERMALEGKITLGEFKVLHDHGGNKVHLPFAHSTRSYPEWPMAKATHTSDTLAKKVAMALMEMPADSEAAQASKIAGWTIPLNYQSVHDTLKFLQIGPYKNFGKVTPLDVIKKYWFLILIDIATLIILAWFLNSRIKMNQSLKIVQEELMAESDERKLSQRHVQHLNLVLKTIGRVNKLIIAKKDPQDLTQCICRVLVENRGFFSAWIVLIDDKKGFTFAGAGLNENFSILKDRIKTQGLAHCGRTVLEQPGVQIIEDPSITCKGCPIASTYKGRSALRIRLENSGNVFGLLTVSVFKEIVNDREELSLLENLAADIGLGLNSMAMDQERKQALTALNKSDEFNKKIIESSNDCIKTLDLDGRLEFMSTGGQKLLEIQDIGAYLQQSWTDSWKGPDHRAALEAVSKARQGETGQFFGFCPTEKGTEKWWDIIITPICDENGVVERLLAISRDITSQKNMEEQFRQAQKMESVGRLAGGMAHDYNNALSVIMGFTEMAMTEINPDEPLHDDLAEVLSAAKRAKDITRQLLAFARKQTIVPEVLNLNERIENMIKMLRRLIGEDINLAWLPGTDLWNVRMDPSQIDQILANLCVNARDAIPGVGMITIETAKISFDQDYCGDHTGFIPGDFILMAISDNGCGMDKEILNNIFEPFFTTKDKDKGTGLGMSMVYGIVKQNKGFINVYSEPGKGTTIKIYLSRHGGSAVRSIVEDKEKNPIGRGETILVVEDDLSILKLLGKILASLGYTLITAGTPREAMELARDYSSNIQLLVTDVIMPEMNGKDLSEQMQSIYPDLKCIFMSGYTANAIAHHSVLDKGVNFIQKPFSKTDMAVLVRKVLDIK